MVKKDSKHVGSTFDSFLEEEELLSEVTALAHKKVIALQILQAMEELDINKTALAKRIKTSRSSLDRVLDPENPSITLLTLDKVAQALGKNIHIELRDN